MDSFSCIQYLQCLSPHISAVEPFLSLDRSYLCTVLECVWSARAHVHIYYVSAPTEQGSADPVPALHRRSRFARHRRVVVRRLVACILELVAQDFLPVATDLNPVYTTIFSARLSSRRHVWIAAKFSLGRLLD